MSDQKDIQDFLFSTGVRSAFNKDTPIGGRVTGRVKAAKMAQATDIDKKPKFFESGDPVMELVIDLQTDERDGPEDDGVRRIYAGGGNWTVEEGTGTSMRDAIAAAMKAIDARSLDETIKLTVAYSGLGKQDKVGYSQPKLYVAKAEKVGGAVSVDDLLG